jgi:hypothetical protein
MVHGGRSHRQGRIGEGQENGSELGHGEYPVGSVLSAGIKNTWGMLHTSATQVTRTPLNSRPSSFSTAVLRSAAVSNSTKLLNLLALKCSGGT